MNTHTLWTHTQSSGQPFFCCGARGAVGGSVPCSRAPQSWYWRWRERCTFTPPTYNSCRTWDSNLWPLGYESDSLSIRPQLPQFSNVNDRIMPMSDAVSFEGPKTTGIQQRSSALSLTHRDFSSFSESFDDVMHCRWWDLQSLCHLTLRNVVFKVFHNLFSHSFTDWRAFAHLYFWETLPL